MRKVLFTLLIIITTFNLQAQVGVKNMNRMNVLLRIHGGANASAISYQSSSGFIQQKLAGYTDHFKLQEIKRIIVRPVEDGSTVELGCDSTDPCINHIDPSHKGTYLSGVSYFFDSKNAANEFAKLADEIIRKDFKKKPYLVLTVDHSATPSPPVMERQEEVEERIAETTKKVNQTVKPKKEVNHLSMDAYNLDENSAEYEATLSKFGKQLIQILRLAKSKQLGKLKDGKEDGVYNSRIKLYQAKRNYLNTYKGEDCFIAEYGTKKNYEDLQDTYLVLRDEIEEALPLDYEPVDMAYEELYEDSKDEVFHTEFYNKEKPGAPSIVIRIAPDGKKNTLYLRIGKK